MLVPRGEKFQNVEAAFEIDSYGDANCKSSSSPPDIRNSPEDGRTSDKRIHNDSSTRFRANTGGVRAPRQASRQELPRAGIARKAGSAFFKACLEVLC